MTVHNLLVDIIGGFWSLATVSLCLFSYRWLCNVRIEPWGLGDLMKIEMTPIMYSSSPKEEPNNPVFQLGK